MGVIAKRFDVFLVNLDPTIGSELQKPRPCVIISPDEMNRNISTVIIAPMITKGQVYPTRMICQFQGKDGQIVLDQILTVDKSRLVKRISEISQDEQREVLGILAEMFAK